LLLSVGLEGLTLQMLESISVVWLPITNLRHGSNHGLFHRLKVLFHVRSHIDYLILHLLLLQGQEFDFILIPVIIRVLNATLLVSQSLHLSSLDLPLDF